MVRLLQVAVGLLPLTLAAPIEDRRRSSGPTVQLSYATVVGSSTLGVDSFKGIPYAQPPVKNLRLKPPQPISGNLGTVQATGLPRACPQFYEQINEASLPSSVIGELLDTPFVQTITDAGEDCLTVNVQRPSTATQGSNLPVLFWIFGGGFELGSTQTTDATSLILTSIVEGKPIIFVSVNYRVGGFGFLGGSQLKAEGSTNLGLLDQRAGLQWVADNIAKFGGDPTKVTIWGESSGSISVLDQMLLYNGNNVYKGNPLFRAAIMDSGSVVPADPVDCPKAEVVFNTVVQNAGCGSAADALSCLRSVDYTTFLNAANSVPGILSYSSVALSYAPRPDGVALTQSPDILVKSGQYAKVPFIIGDQEDEGTIFALTQGNITTTADIVNYLKTYFFSHASVAQIQTLVNLYPDDPSAGSPFGTGLLYNLYPQYKRLAALLGDLTFTLTRRVFLQWATAANPSVPSWSYLASYDYGTPVLGTFHASDLLPAFGTTPGVPATTIQSYYLSFVNTLNPNDGALPTLPDWPTWASSRQLVNFNALSNDLIADDFRSAVSNFIAAAGPQELNI